LKGEIDRHVRHSEPRQQRPRRPIQHLRLEQQRGRGRKRQQQQPLCAACDWEKFIDVPQHQGNGGQRHEQQLHQGA
jgi:hypothetical protein